jgi:hypothetical protein
LVGATFPVGTSVVNFTATDANNNTASCSVTIIVLDNRPPVFVNCPANITVGNDVNKCGSNVVFATPIATDNCGATVAQTVGLASGSLFPVGTTTVTFVASDNATPPNTVSCNFTVTVMDMQPPTAVCQNVVLNLNAAGTGAITTAQVNGGTTDNCPGTLTYALSNTNFTCSNIGQNNVTLTVTDGAGNTSTCVATITVRDIIPPTFTCPNPLTVDGCNALVPDVVTGIVNEADNCGVAGTVQNPVAGLAFGQVSGNLVNITVTVTDINGNIKTCVVPVTIQDDDEPDFLNCPTQMLMFGNDPDQCNGKVNWQPPVAVDDCIPLPISAPGTPMPGTVVQTTGPLSGTAVAITCPPTPTLITYVATDGVGNQSTCSFFVMVVDTEKPELDADIIMPNDTTVNCHQVPSNCVYHGPSTCTPLTNNDVNDNCTTPGNISINYNQISTQNTNNALCTHYNYSLTRTWTISDCAGNALVHTQKIQVRDTTKPVVLCKPISVTLDKNGKAIIVPADVNNGSSDNCAPAALLNYQLIGLTTFTCANIGSNTVTLKVTDPCGNFSTCAAIVTVNEGIAPCTPQYNVVTSCLDNATDENNGQFQDVITIKSLAMQTWTVTANTGFFVNNSPNPPVAPIAMPIGTAFVLGTADGIDNDNDGTLDEADEMIYYTLKGRFTECIGYNISVSNAGGIGMATAATTSTIANKACYPSPYFLNLLDPFCSNTPPFTIEVGEYNNAQGTVSNITVDGIPTNTFNAAALGLGFHTVMATFDAGTALNTLTINGVVQAGSGNMAGAIADPGCKQKITKQVQIVTTPTTVVCNNNVQVSLDADCNVTITADMVLEGTYYCYDDYKVVITYPSGTSTFTPPNTVNASHIGLTLNYTLVHPTSGNMCWGKLKVEDKLAPALTCPPNKTLHCNECTTTACTGIPGITDCDNTTTQFTEVVSNPGQCTGTQLEYKRTWVVTDDSGNQSSCQQTITIIPFAFPDVIFPADITMSCTNISLGTASTNPVFTGRPSIAGFPIGNNGLCAATVGYDDVILNLCTGDYEIIRKWLVRNACLPLSANNPVEHFQLIKVVDGVGPAFACPSNLTVSTEAASCCARIDLPDVIVTEHCSQIISAKASVIGPDSLNNLIQIANVNATLSNFTGNNYWIKDTLAVFAPITNCLKIGTYNVTYSFEDQCNNITNCVFDVTVRDLVTPTTVCDEFTQIGLGLDGTAFVDAIAYDNGSVDNCGPVYFKARRMDANQIQSVSALYDQVKFACEDIGDTVRVILRVFDVNPGSGVLALDAFEGHYSECMINTFVEDKIKPTCTAPAAVTVSCEAFDPSLVSYGTATTVDNCSNPTLTNAVVLTQFDSLCSKGTITRRWTVVDAAGNSAVCSQRIVVTYEQNYWVKFPADRIVTVCDGASIFGAPEFYGEDCELMATSYVDEFFTVIPDACYKIERTWTVINWCKYDPNLPANSALNIYIPNPSPNATANHPTNLPGVTVSAPGTTVNGWLPTSVKINPTDPNPTNYATFWNKDANSYTYKQIVKVLDGQDPSVTCPVSPVEICDYSNNDPEFYNATQYWDQLINSHDLCEGDANIEITATDACSGAAISFRYLLFLDMDGNGSTETVINSVNLPGFNNINYNNANNQNYTGGTPWQFDFRPVPNDRKWGWGIQVDAPSGNNRSARVRWFNQANNPLSGAVPQLPYGNHRIKWIIEDGCGNEKVCEYNFSVKDCKKPTVVCLNGLAVNISMTSNLNLQLWATDFLQYAEDNCTPAAQIKIAVRKKGMPDGQGSTTGFPKNADGSPQTGISFGCSDMGTQLVELWGVDKAGNADYCETYILIQDNTGLCGVNASIAGALKTEVIEGVEDVTVELQSNGTGVPNMEVFSVQTGDYYFSNALPYSSNATITPTLELDPLNGVNTWDLILISRHILGLEPLNTPFKLISADANKSGTVTTFDIVELRKLILGTYQKLPNNSSWRFVNKAQVFTNPQNPFADVIQEDLQIIDIQQHINNGDFVAAKIGDVDISATPNNLIASDERTTGTLMFDIQDQYAKTGEVFQVTFTADQYIKGYQYTINLNGLAVERIEGANMSQDNFAIFADAFTTSWDAPTTFNGKASFTVTFKALKDGNLSQMLGVSSRITQAVAFTGTTRYDIALRFKNDGTPKIAAQGFELYQNVPNPWVNKTNIGFYLPADATAILTIYDAMGRTIHTTKGDFKKGQNTFVLDRSNIGFTAGSAEFFYKVETLTDSSLKRMILVR